MGWVLVGTLLSGALNYGYTLALVLLLSPTEYSAFAGAQSLLLLAGTVAASTIPWVLAHELATGSGDHLRRQQAVWFALSVNAAQGLVAAVVVVAVSASFADPATLAALAGASLMVFVASTMLGWAQGLERFRLLGGLIVLEVVVKIALGVLLVEAGLGTAGAIGGAIFGAAAVIAVTGPAMNGDLRPSRFPTALRALWRKAIGMGSVQVGVTGLAVLDVIIAAVLLAAGSELATFQLAATLGRVPLFFAVAISTVVFPALSRDPSQGARVVDAFARLLWLSVPFYAAAATAPPELLNAVLPAGYEEVGRFLPFTAAAGVAYAAVLLSANCLKAISAFRVTLRALATAAVVVIPLLIAGAVAFGELGIAATSAAGGALTLALVMAAVVRIWPGLRWRLLVAPALLILALPILVLARDYTGIWIALVVSISGASLLAALTIDQPESSLRS